MKTPVNDCKDCTNIQWKNHYLMAQQRFDKVMSRMVMGSIVAFTVVVLCLVATICVILKFEKFISEFEYVEETIYEVDQDDGINTAILGSNDVEVVVNGTDNKGENT